LSRAELDASLMHKQIIDANTLRTTGTVLSPEEELTPVSE
jgi:hypothetical protein